MAKVPGSVWIEGNDFHYVDQFNREWFMIGVLVKAVSGARPGSVWVDNSKPGFFYVNEAGTNIYTIKSLQVGVALENAREGSVWISQENRMQWISKSPSTGEIKLILSAHNDTATVSGHQDLHHDSIHTDIPHSDTAHTDVPNNALPHSDGHNDVPHQDYFQDIHTDYWEYAPGTLFTDHYDAYRTVHQDGQVGFAHMDTYWAPSGKHEDYQKFAPGGAFIDSEVPYHGDQSQHTDIPHQDWHADSHQDTPHRDSPPINQHGDFTDAGSGHGDIAHVDTIHTDVAHTDAHEDAHQDVAHQDEPIFIG